MCQADFDKFAQDYSAQLDEAIRFSGEQGDYFVRYKLNSLKRWVVNNETDLVVLDFGCGTGDLAHLLAEAFPEFAVYGFDVSSKIVEVARRRFSGVNNLRFLDHLLPDQMFDVIYSANVFHHLPVGHCQSTLLQLKALLKPTGKLVIFEHNPWNPLTRYVVKTCRFDADARLIYLAELIKMARRAGLTVFKTRYIVFFPSFLGFLRRLEPCFGFLPFGAQYMLILTQ